ncbi:MAG: hypothetical protein JXR78_03590 [Victivallales bacterium]|nr:hypothetical protein [Victivallales bacterium]
MYIPIIFIHQGYSSYLEFSLRQARYFCPDSEIILLGDDSNDCFDFITHINIHDFHESADAFAAVYKHCSTNPYSYELFCFQRWFILEEFIRKSGKYDQVFVCDSDVLLYSDIDKLAKRYWQDYELGLIIYSDDKYSIGISYCTETVLNRFCEFTTRQYTEDNNFSRIQARWDEIVSSGQPGSYCDMCAIESFCKENDGELKYFNITKYAHHGTFDFHINIPNCWEQDMYRFRWGRKRFAWRQKCPYSMHVGINRYAKFHCIHFQGPAKYLIASFYTAPPFKGMFKLKIRYFFLNFMAFWYKTLKIRYRFAFVFNYIFSKDKGTSN